MGLKVTQRYVNGISYVSKYSRALGVKYGVGVF
jgi:hypothetical protein